MFGRPPGSLGSILSTPPDRGSFPLDHDGECKNAMAKYLACLKANKNQADGCRVLSKDYLECRMQKGLMERDTWDNLGLSDVDPSKKAEPSKTVEQDTPSSSKSA
ncbi:hypothetical protein DL93DRAFT_2142683 [Clavulina sp. PMI_390]|nr:hypothetical protein DL93DRAFT_2142683 [Clavulina sp. PMI_390]